MTHIFISYSRQDVEFVRYLRTLLEAHGLPVWMDEAGIDSGARWWRMIEENIDTCGAFVVVMSPSAAESDWVEREILRAENRRKPIYPVLLTGEAWSRLANIQYEDLRAGLRAKPSERFLQRLTAHFPHLNARRTVEFTIIERDILEAEGDVIALKFARYFQGADAVVANALSAVGIDSETLRPPVDEYIYLETQGALGTPHVVFYGMPHVRRVSYADIRRMCSRILETLSEIAPNTRHLVMTMHGPGFGLDETEAILSQVAGYIDALEAGTFPAALEKISIFEMNGERVTRLQKALEPSLAQASFAMPINDGWGYRLAVGAQMTQDSGSAIESAGKKARISVFVAIPPDEDLDDVFYYAVQAPVHALGLLCERVDEAASLEDALAYARTRIDSAAAVIADLTKATALTYLQVGYAWGKELPTLLLARKGSNSVITQHCHRYDRLRDVESHIAAELGKLREKGQL